MHKQKAGWPPSKFPSLRGFTLLELIVVIAIIGILSVAIIPSITGALARARDARSISNVNSIKTVLVLYGIENGGFPRPNVAENVLREYNNSNAITLITADSTGATPGVHYACVGNNTNKQDSNACSGFHIWTQLERGDANALGTDADFDSSASNRNGLGSVLNAEVPTPNQGTEACDQGINTGVTCVYDLTN